MKHLTLSSQGSLCKLQGNRIIVLQKDEVIFEGTLNRLKSIHITKSGVCITSNLLVACAMRGIQIFIVDYTGKAVCSVQGGHHRTAKVRENQFLYIHSTQAHLTASRFIVAKLKNQAAVLKYFAKAKNRPPAEREILHNASSQITIIIDNITKTNWVNRNPEWRFTLLGFEGSAARIYWGAVKGAGLVANDFENRRPRVNEDITNSMLNYA